VVYWNIWPTGSILQTHKNYDFAVINNRWCTIKFSEALNWKHTSVHNHMCNTQIELNFLLFDVFLLWESMLIINVCHAVHDHYILWNWLWISLNVLRYICRRSCSYLSQINFILGNCSCNTIGVFLETNFTGILDRKTSILDYLLLL